MTRRPKRAKPPVDKQACEDAKAFVRVMYDPEGEKKALDELVELIERGEPLDRKTWRFVASELRHFNSQLPRRGSRDWKARQNLAAPFLVHWFWKAGMTKGDANQAAADELGIKVDALRKRPQRGLVRASDIKIMPYLKELRAKILSHFQAKAADDAVPYLIVESKNPNKITATEAASAVITDEFKVMVEKECMRWLYSPEWYKALNEDLIKQVENDEPDRTTRKLIAQQLRRFYSLNPAATKSAWHNPRSYQHKARRLAAIPAAAARRMLNELRQALDQEEDRWMKRLGLEEFERACATARRRAPSWQRCREQIAARLLKKWLREFGMSAGEADEGVADALGIEVDALEGRRKRYNRWLANRKRR